MPQAICARRTGSKYHRLNFASRLRERNAVNMGRDSNNVSRIAGERMKRKRISPYKPKPKAGDQNVLPFVQKETVPTEHQEQVTLCRILRYAQIYYASVPNEGKRSYATAARLTSSGMVRGFPDLLIFTPPPSDPFARGVAIEMKRRRGGVISTHQRDQIAKLEACGWRTCVARGCDEALIFLSGLGYRLPAR